MSPETRQDVGRGSLAILATYILKAPPTAMYECGHRVGMTLALMRHPEAMSPQIERLFHILPYEHPLVRHLSGGAK